ncbi:hypothetical protein BDY21DRAFT_156867 [Lineolata rhizophorae]|uniref:Uncharacterized protein n=1 Tax=Lineolata rhizophorae TaxID=578093 RepID=A0A6A6NLU0_9PEZI|nr:hypothetical protein BDY21DRAFT_156867 [Lineolata rhizophorae]
MSRSVSAKNSKIAPASGVRGTREMTVRQAPSRGPHHRVPGRRFPGRRSWADLLDLIESTRWRPPAAATLSTASAREPRRGRKRSHRTPGTPALVPSQPGKELPGLPGFERAKTNFEAEPDENFLEPAGRAMMQGARLFSSSHPVLGRQIFPWSVGLSVCVYRTL